MSVTLYTFNAYLEQQSIWDGTCGYHAIKNTLNLMYLLNEYHITHPTYQFSDILEDGQFICRLNNTDLSNRARSYYMKLTNGATSTTLNNLKDIIKTVDNNNNLYFWDIYEERATLIKLVNEKVVGVYGTIVYYEDSFCKHWYGCVFDIMPDKIYIYLLDSFSLIWPHSKALYDKVLTSFNFKEINYEHNYSKLLIYAYKIYQLMLFVIVYFIIIYALLSIFIKWRKNIM
jgi:hypothetical protein